jgi:hypothetical protein
MTLTIELAPEVAAAVQRQAELRGERVEDLVGNLVERSIHILPELATASTQEEFERDWDEILAPIEGLPERAPCDYTREDIYFDHD